MQRTILITGSTDGIGLETAEMLVSLGHHVLLHGRNPSKLEDAEKTLSALPGDGRVESYVADLSLMANVEALAEEVAGQHAKLDVLINNAGVFKASDPVTADGLDVRFAVNTIAPYLLTRRLLPLIGTFGRASDQPLLRGPVSGRSKGVERRSPAFGWHGIRTEQAGADHVVSSSGAFARGSRSGHYRGESRVDARHQDGERGL